MSTGKRAPKKGVRTATVAKRTPKKAAAKRTTAATAKKATKKSAGAKTARKPVTKKTATAKSVSRAPSKPEKALKPQRKDTIKDTFKKGDRKPFSFPQSVSLAVISMPRLPLDVDALAVGLARYSGVAFVVIGALFTIFFAQHAGLQLPLAAAVIDSDTATSNVESTTNTRELSSIDKKPDVRFDVTAKQPVSDIVEVIISVALADKVNIFAFHRESQEYIPVGYADKVSNETWKVRWNTQEYENGTYRLKAQIVNQYGSYDDTADEYIAVRNISATKEATESVISNIAFEFHEQTDTNLRIVLHPDVDPDSIRVYAANRETKKELELGSATKKEARAWELVTSRERLQSGEYDVFAVATKGDDTFTSKRHYYQSETKDAENTEETYSPEVVSKVKISFAEQSDGRVKVLLHPDVQPEYMEVKAVFTKTGLMKELGRATKHTDNSWTATFETKAFDPGVYAIYATAVTGDTKFTSSKVDYTISATRDVDDEVKEVETDVTEDSETKEQDVTPIEALTLTVPTTVRGLTTITAHAPGAQFVEVYARSKRSEKTQFIGLANQQLSGVWKFVWNTTNIPNGAYYVTANAKLPTKMLISKPQITEVINEALVTKDPQKLAQTEMERTSVVEEVKKTVEAVTAVRQEIRANAGDFSNDSNTLLVPERIQNSKVLSLDEVPEEITLDAETKSSVDTALGKLLVEYQQRIATALQALATAIRSEDEIAIAQARATLDGLRGEIMQSALESKDTSELTTYLENRLRRELAKRKLETERSEQIIKDRVGSNATKDTDEDGITDFDEVHIYGTDPLVADSDNDGFLDGIEILGGYNPNDATPEASVAYESPRESGIVRPDILSIETITPVTPDVDDENLDGVLPKAIISGKALPNSFVTLYIFSNPVIVTVKTDADGNWNYRFDKEIADGTHEVYVGVTDNAGRLIAKSEPLQFVKTAEAFSPVDVTEGASVLSQSETEEPLFSGYMLLLVASISVVSIGLVLILLGLHLHRRPEEPVIVADEPIQV